MTNATLPPLPYLPPLDEDGVRLALRQASERLVELWDAEWLATEEALGGFWKRPARQRGLWFLFHGLQPMWAEAIRRDFTDFLAVLLPRDPYWATLFELNPKETERMLKDFAEIIHRGDDTSG